VSDRVHEHGFVDTESIRHTDLYNTGLGLSVPNARADIVR